ncbi:MAG: hypothetical protein ABI823_16110 [Bryobacteraceae bacterium]
MRSTIALLVGSALIAASLFAQEKRDPAAWGSSHAGKEIPEFVHGDECLFCHRADIGHDWPKNAHGATLREVQDAPDLAALLKDPKAAPFAKEVTHFLGSRNFARFLKKDGYNKFDIQELRAVKSAAGWTTAGAAGWNKTKFQDQCAGCHATAIDPATKSFGAIGHDCYVCHGVVDLNHTKDTSLIWLSKKKHGDTKAVTSICAACHLRGMAKAKSTGLPYPNNFVVGDNLFKDYQVDFSKLDDPNLNAGDKHVLRNVQDVAVLGSDVTCLSCHRVHTHNTERHRRVLTTASCQDCHNASGPKKEIKKYAVHSALCEY